MRVKLDKGAYMPEKAHKTDAGFDIRTPIAFDVPPCQVDIWKNRNGTYFANVGTATIDTGVHIELPLGTVGMLKSKSGLNVKYGITSEGVIDVGYTGSIVAKLYNHTDKTVHFNAGDKITQLVIMPCVSLPLEQVDELEETERGNNGFGSTGR